MKFAISEVVDFYLLAQHISSEHQKQSLQKNKRLNEYFPNKVLKEQCVNLHLFVRFLYMIPECKYKY
jgi:hypothetical protein